MLREARNGLSLQPALTLAPSGHSETSRAMREATKSKVVIIPVTDTKQLEVTSSAPVSHPNSVSLNYERKHTHILYHTKY